jgi:MFS transporter, DHA1 family, tetracycline resistance protein
VNITKANAAVSFVFVTVMLDMLAFGVIIPVLPKLLLDMNGGDAGSAADWNGWLGTGWALMQFVFSPILGSLSDRFGRRPIILISNFGMAADFVLLALAPDLWWLLIARLISGAVSASVTTAYAYVADVTPPDGRAKAFGVLGAAFGVGFVIGPALGGWLGHYDPRWPFWGAAALAFLNGCYGYFVLPESLPPENRSGFSWAKANPVGGLIFLLERGRLIGFAALNFFAQLAHYALPSIFILFALTRYGWGTKEAGIMMTIVGIGSIIVQGYLVGKINPLIGHRASMMLGYGFGALGYAIFAWAPNGMWLYVGIPVMSLWGLAGPAMMAMMSTQVDASDQGKLQGMNSGVTAIAGLIGPTLYSQTLKYGMTAQAGLSLMGLPFYIAAGLLLLCILIAYRITRRISVPATL